MKVNYKKTDSRAVAPRRGHKTDFCFDVQAIEVEQPNEQHPNTYKVRTGLAFEIQLNIIERLIFWLFGLVPSLKAYSRSSIKNYGLSLSNGTGIVDYGYRGEVTAEFYKFPFLKSDIYTPGERAFQLAVEIGFLPELQEVEELTNGERGTRGYGSTGK